MISKPATFNILRSLPVYQQIEDGSTACLYQLLNDLLGIETGKSQYPKLGVATLQRCPGMNRIKLFRKRLSSTTDVTLLCLTSPLQL